MKSASLHAFVDASSNVYGAVVYYRHDHSDETVSVHLVASESRVAPLTATSILHLQLMRAILGFRLSALISKALKIATSEITAWPDSMNVLW